jgi:hypothetical protein
MTRASSSFLLYLTAAVTLALLVGPLAAAESAPKKKQETHPPFPEFPDPPMEEGGGEVMAMSSGSGGATWDDTAPPSVNVGACIPERARGGR